MLSFPSFLFILGIEVEEGDQSKGLDLEEDAEMPCSHADLTFPRRDRCEKCIADRKNMILVFVWLLGLHFHLSITLTSFPWPKVDYAEPKGAACAGTVPS